MAEIPNNNNNVDGGAALVVQPRKPLCEFSIPKVTDQPSCIVYPQLTVDRNSFQLKRLTRLDRKSFVSHKRKEKLFMNVGRGLLDSERMMVDATSGEGLMNKTAEEAFTLFESLSANSQQWSHNKGRGAPMKAVAVAGPLGNAVEVQDQSFAEHMLEQANALQARNPNNDPYSNTYNPGWRNHPNFKWSNNSNVQQSQGPPPGFLIQQRQFQQAPQQVQEQKVNKLEVQVGQIASSLSNRASGTFPSQTEVNPRHQEHAKAVHILRSGKQVDNKVGDANEEQEDGENVEILQPPHGQPTGSTKQPLNAPERAQALRIYALTRGDSKSMNKLH
ncbi:unnamed protein product [Prunus brigantina]